VENVARKICDSRGTFDTEESYYLNSLTSSIMIIRSNTFELCYTRGYPSILLLTYLSIVIQGLRMKITEIDFTSVHLLLFKNIFLDVRGDFKFAPPCTLTH
jgi:hypothetical protein